MILNDFIHFNQKCPVCDGELTLYLQVQNSTCFKGQKHKNNYIFSIHSSASKSFYEQDCITLFDYGNNYDFKFSSSKLVQEIQNKDIVFYYSCRKNDGTSCYTRTSIYFKLDKTNNNNWIVKAVESSHEKIINQCELFNFLYADDIGGDKHYSLNMNYIENKTTFSYFYESDKQKIDPKYTPIFFKKEMPLLIARPNFNISNRDKLFKRFESWISIS